MKTFLAAITFALVLSGCTTPADESVQDIATDASRPLAGAGIHYASCVEHAGVFPVPAALMEGVVLPSGFTPVPADDQGATVYLVVAVDDCVGGNVGDKAVDRAAEFWGILPVIPTEEYLAEGIGAYAVALGAVVTDANAAAAYQAWGFPTDLVYAGSVSQETIAATGLRNGHAIGWTDNFTVELRTTAVGGTIRGDGGMQRMFVVSDGNITGAIDSAYSSYMAPSTSGAATLSFPDPATGVPLNVMAPDGGAGFGYQFYGYATTISYVPASMLISVAPEAPVPAQPTQVGPRMLVL